jgi:hypothetical protein
MVFTFLWGFGEPFMQKWSATWRSIQTHEAGNSAEVASKILNKRKKTHFHHHFATQFWEPFSAPKIGTSYKGGKRNGGQKTAPNLGPHFRSFGCTFLVPASHFLAVASTLAQQFGSLRRSLVLNHDGQKGVLSKSVDKDSI